MNYLKTSINWEEFFIQEALELEEKMKSFDLESLNKSKLLIALENHILDWKRYESWFSTETGCASFKSNLVAENLQSFLEKSSETYQSFSHLDFWDSTLMPLMVWDQQVFVMGLQYPDQLMSLEKHVFILTPPHILSLFAEKIFSTTSETTAEVDNSNDSMLDGIDMDIQAPKIDFSSATGVQTSQPSTIWDFISERHDEYSFEAKKHFNAYVVLKVNQSKTSVFKMDADLAKEGISTTIFEYSLKEENPFQKVFQSGNSESFSLSQLGLQIRNFKYACITALRRGDTVVGFLIGFKEAHLAEKDQTLLEELAKESA